MEGQTRPQSRAPPSMSWNPTMKSKGTQAHGKTRWKRQVPTNPHHSTPSHSRKQTRRQPPHLSTHTTHHPPWSERPSAETATRHSIRATSSTNTFPAASTELSGNQPAARRSRHLTRPAIHNRLRPASCPNYLPSRHRLLQTQKGTDFAPGITLRSRRLCQRKHHQHLSVQIPEAPQQ